MTTSKKGRRFETAKLDLVTLTIVFPNKARRKVKVG